MTPKEHLIECLRRLCKAKGGEDAVAEAAGISAENLKQITAGTKLKSGNPRGVGPGLQQKLEAAFPGWAGLDKASAAPGSPSVAYVAEKAATLDKRRLKQLVHVVDFLAGPHGDLVTVTISIAPHAAETTPAPVEAK